MAVYAGLGSIHVPVFAQAPQAGQGGPEYLGGCVSGPPAQPAGGGGRAAGGQGQAGAGRGGQFGGRGAGRGGRGAAPAAAAAPRLPDNKEAYGVNAGKPDLG